MDSKPQQQHDALKISGLQHVSKMCSDVSKSSYFYIHVLGFKLVKRPNFNVDGAWCVCACVGIYRDALSDRQDAVHGPDAIHYTVVSIPVEGMFGAWVTDLAPGIIPMESTLETLIWH